MKTFRDPIYDYISCSDDEIRLIDSPWFQRLRHCAQNGPARLVYPSLSGTRFEHSLGVMSLAGKAVDSIFDPLKYQDTSLESFISSCQNDFKKYLHINIRKNDVHEKIKRYIRLAGLLHDIGHFPLSHTSEFAFAQLFWNRAIPVQRLPKRNCHEVISAEVIRHLAYELDAPLLDKDDAKAVIMILICQQNIKANNRSKSDLSKTVFPALSSIIVGDFDVDRLDYLQRDGHLSGTGFGKIDVDRLLECLRVCVNEKNVSINKPKFMVLPSLKGLSTIESVIFERYKESCWVINHHKSLFFEEIVREIATKIFSSAEFKRKVFIKYDQSKYCSIEEYKEKSMQIPGPLSLNERGDILPLNIYPGDIIDGNDNDYWILNTDFFIKDETSCFIDDIWFCSQFRSIDMEHEYLPQKFFSETILERKKTGMCIWKDFSGYSDFIVDLGTTLRTRHRERLRKHTGDFKISKDLFNNFLKEVFSLITIENCDTFWEHLGDAIKNKIECKSIVEGNFNIYLALVHWGKFFLKSPDNKFVCDSQGTILTISDADNVLESLSFYRGNIPFFLYFASINEIMGKVDKQIMRKAFVDGVSEGILNAWDDDLGLADIYSNHYKEDKKDKNQRTRQRVKNNET